MYNCRYFVTLSNFRFFFLSFKMVVVYQLTFAELPASYFHFDLSHQWFSDSCQPSMAALFIFSHSVLWDKQRKESLASVYWTCDYLCYSVHCDGLETAVNMPLVQMSLLSASAEKRNTSCFHCRQSFFKIVGENSKVLVCAEIEMHAWIRGVLPFFTFSAKVNGTVNELLWKNTENQWCC